MQYRVVLVKLQSKQYEMATSIKTLPISLFENMEKEIQVRKWGKLSERVGRVLFYFFA